MDRNISGQKLPCTSNKFAVVLLVFFMSYVVFYVIFRNNDFSENLLPLPRPHLFNISHFKPSSLTPNYTPSTTLNPWEKVPEVELFVRMYSGRKTIYEDFLIQSMKLFWPDDRLKLLVVLDDESPRDHILGKELQKKYPWPRVMFDKPNSFYHKNGHKRQQWTMFHADKFTNAEYVGFVDTDTLFLTVVTPQSLFTQGKPVIIGQIGNDNIQFWRAVSSNTVSWFKQKEVLRCMSYFPVIIKVQHITMLRQKVAELHGRPFDDVFRDLTRGIFSQFSIMCQYIWLYHRDEYDFHYQELPNSKWTTKQASRGRFPKEFYMKNTKEEERKPKARLAIHAGWAKPLAKNKAQMTKAWLEDKIGEGFCLSMGLKYCSNKCKKYNVSNHVQKSMFLFEMNDWTWHPKCLEAQQKHYKDVENLISYYIETKKTFFNSTSVQNACERWPEGFIIRSRRIWVDKY